MNKAVEIMAPAGSFDSLAAALQGGADSVYFGIEQLNMRAKGANNFSIDDLREIVTRCSEQSVKTYLTVNTILYDHDIKLMQRICDAAKAAGVTAIIACDIAAIQYAHSIGQEIHISTQLNVTNIEALKFYAQYADVIVLARELTLSQIKEIVKEIKEQDIRGPKGELVEIEIFAHGALCVAISGKCYMSLATYNSSANRGACLQNCRHAYRVIDEETGDELVVDNKYIMSPKDLCTIGFVDKLIDAGVSVLKLEGRGRAPEYVKTVTQCYREAAEAVLDGTYTEEKVAEWTTRLETVFNRGLWHGGYYLGKKLGEWSGQYGSQATTEKRYIGKVSKFFPKSNIGEFVIESEGLRSGAQVLITGQTTGVLEVVVDSLYQDGKAVFEVAKGTKGVTFPVSSRVRRNDKVYVVIPRST